MRDTINIRCDGMELFGRSLSSSYTPSAAISMTFLHLRLISVMHGIGFQSFCFQTLTELTLRTFECFPKILRFLSLQPFRSPRTATILTSNIALVNWRAQAEHVYDLWLVCILRYFPKYAYHALYDVT
jgi:hypothetical protein